jgi:hypothetical protein
MCKREKSSNYAATYVRGVGQWNLLGAANVGDNLLGVLLARSLGSVEVHNSVAVITALATTTTRKTAIGGGLTRSAYSKWCDAAI